MRSPELHEQCVVLSLPVFAFHDLTPELPVTPPKILCVPNQQPNVKKSRAADIRFGSGFYPAFQSRPFHGPLTLEINFQNTLK
jgi:hypothetical protein